MIELVQVAAENLVINANASQRFSNNVFDNTDGDHGIPSRRRGGLSLLQAPPGANKIDRKADGCTHSRERNDRPKSSALVAPMEESQPDEADHKASCASKKRGLRFELNLADRLLTILVRHTPITIRHRSLRAFEHGRLLPWKPRVAFSGRPRRRHATHGSTGGIWLRMS
ncbi:MAG: hypothetical protein ACT4TC_20905 [Myxococcaceae bacterium]